MDRTENGHKTDYRLTPVAPFEIINIQEFERVKKMDLSKPLVKSLSFQGNVIAFLGVIGEALKEVSALPLPGGAGLIVAISGIALSTLGTYKRKRRIRGVL